jgi:hypothetical protein
MNNPPVHWGFVVLPRVSYQLNIQHYVCRNVPLVHFCTSMLLIPGYQEYFYRHVRTIPQRTNSLEQRAALVIINITALCKGTSRGNMYKGLRLRGSHCREVARQGASQTQERHSTFFDSLLTVDGGAAP